MKRKIILAASIATALAIPVAAQDGGLSIHPAAVTLDDARDSHRLVVLHTRPDGITREVTDECAFVASDVGVVEVEGGVVRGSRWGEVELVARFGELTAGTRVVVRDAASVSPVSFRNDVLPVLTRAGCNAGACHGAASGKNGFGLSLFGFDPSADHERLTREARGRRLDCADPDASLVLKKPSGRVRHKGGKPLDHDGVLYERFRDWIAEGAVDDGDAAPALITLAIEPAELVLAGRGESSRLVVSARYGDGSIRDVTDLALIGSSSDSTAAVEVDGRVVAREAGEAFVLVRFGFLAEVAQVIVLSDETPYEPNGVTPINEIDEFVHGKLAKLRLHPTGVCDDATFVRRIYLDVIGLAPTGEEVRRFLDDDRSDKRARLVDALLERPEFPEVQAAQWAEVLRVESQALEPKGMHLYTRWLRESFRDGVPFDQIVRELLTASGSGFDHPPANYYVATRATLPLAESCAQTFLGIRVQCAQCHNHPFERWTMDDYYGFAAFFGQVGRKRGEDPRETVVFDQQGGQVNNKRTGRAAPPRFLGGDEVEIPAGADRRAVLADWLTSPDNRWFARNVANRVWARFFGRGLVHPVDDVRVSNPPSHPALYAWLGRRLAESGFDVRDLIRQICASRTYQAAQIPAGVPAATYAGREPRRLSAEQMLDAISAVTGVPTKFRGLPLGASATQVADGNPSNRFLDLFGRPRRESACACDRREEPTLNQVLHLINGATIEQKIRAPGGRLAKAVAGQTAPNQMLDELFLAAYARLPRAGEREHLLGEITAAKDPKIAWEDAYWALLNSKEFLFQH